MAAPEMNQYQRACQIWSVLAWAASKSQNILYEELGTLTGLRQDVLGEYLGLINKYCDRKKIPQLNSIVVNRTGETGKSKPRNIDHKTGKRITLPQAQMNVRLHGKKWLTQRAPKPSDLKRL